MGTSRRESLAWLVAAGPGLSPATWAAGEPPPETTRLRLSRIPSICIAPQYVAGELLRAEGFTQIEYVGTAMQGGGVPGAQVMGAGDVDFAMNFAAPLVVALDMGVPISLLGGVHVGCFEVFVGDRVHTIKDLKGKTVAILNKGSAQHVFLASIATSVGLDPNRDIDWVDHPPADAKRLLAEGKIDAFLGFPPDPQELRARKIGRVLLNSGIDRPWSQYFCCLVAANTEFVRKHPIAAKRALRAILKASELCAGDPDLAANAYLAQGFKTDPALARQAVRELAYGHWRDYNPEETVRFYALRLREAGMVKASPQKLIAQGTDWRFLERLKRELKT
jgi:NitT/TauT family transport system substrate-binding protein